MKKKANPIKRFHNKSVSEKITYILFFIFFLTMSLVFLYPIYTSVITSFTTEDAYVGKELNTFWDLFTIPGVPQFDTWRDINSLFKVDIGGGTGVVYLPQMLWNSLWFTFLKDFLSLLCSFLLAYAVSKFNFPGKSFLYLVAIFVQTIPLFGTGASSYKLFDFFGMVNNPLLFWVAWCTGFDFTFIILHGALSGISNSYSESAKIDGANNFTILIKIMVPMLAPVLLALFISNSLGVWNDYSTIMVYLPDFPTLSYGLYQFQSTTSTTGYTPNATAVQAAVTIISTVPLIILYSVSQKLILTNISVGGLKG